jgi:Sep15/SelM redox domain
MLTGKECVRRDFPNVEDFLKKYQNSLFKDVLTIQYRWMSPPRLILKAGRERLTIRIDSWKTEHILEFLQEKLGMSDGKQAS